MSYQVIIKPAAQRQIRKLPRAAQVRVVARIEVLAETPYPPDVRKLTGSDDLFRVRVGDYRIIYQVRDAKLLVLVVKVGHRRDIYDR